MTLVINWYLTYKYSIGHTGWLFFKDYVFLTFTKNIVKAISQNLRSKYSRKCIDYAKQSVIYALKATSKIVIQKMAEATGYLVGNENANNTVKTALQSATETPTKIDEKLIEISKEK